MTSELICPFCGEKLYSSGDCYFCLNDDCVFRGFYFMKKRWKAIIELKQALIQAKQDLEIATKALKDMMESGGDGYHIARKALEQIEQKE